MPDPVPAGDKILFPRIRSFESKPEHPLHLTVAVCKNCNNGWMSALEELTKPILASLINGEANTVDLPSAHLLARWAGKTMIALERDDPSSATAHRAQIRDVRLGRPLRWSSLWFARSADPLEPILIHASMAIVDPRSGVQVAVGNRTYIGLGNLLMQLVSLDHPLTEDAYLYFAIQDYWVPIWPSKSSTIQLGDEIVSKDMLRQDPGFSQF